MKKRGKISTLGGICVGEAVRKDGKLALLIKLSKKDYYNVITSEELEHQVVQALETDRV